MTNHRRRQIHDAETGGAAIDGFLELKSTAVRFRHIYRPVKVHRVNNWNREAEAGLAVKAPPHQLKL
jgi:hypothetical protein